jgi:hypothetical protein
MIPSLNSNFTFPKAFEFIIPPWTALASRQAVPPMRVTHSRDLPRMYPHAWLTPHPPGCSGALSGLPLAVFRTRSLGLGCL